MSKPAVPPRRQVQSPRANGAAAPAVTTASAAGPAAPTAPTARPAVPANSTQLPQAPSGRMSLTNIVSGRIVKPMRLLVYGLEGVGKSTFAASAPNPIYLGAEDGTSELDVRRFAQPEQFVHLLEAIAELTTAEHGFQTLVIDTLDWAEPFIWKRVCETCAKPGRPPLRSIEEMGYGKGYVEAGGFWRQLIAALERLRERRRMDVVLLAHSEIKTFKNPAGEDFDRYQMKLHKGAAATWREWCDAVLFADHDITTYEDDRKRTKGIGSKARILRTEHNAAWDAKNRYDLPATLPLDWEAFAEAAAAHRPDDPARLRTQIDRLLEQVADNAKLVVRVGNARDNAGDNAGELARILNKLAAKIATTPTDDDEEEATQ
jgi:AAA domain